MTDNAGRNLRGSLHVRRSEIPQQIQYVIIPYQDRSPPKQQRSRGQHALSILTASHLVPVGTLWAILTTFTAYLLVVLSMAASTSHGSLLRNPDIIQDTSLYAPTILAGEIAVTFFSALMGIVGAARLMQALARDKLFPGLFLFGRGTKRNDEPFAAVFLTYLIAQLALLANLDQLASLVSIFYMVSYVHSLPYVSEAHPRGCLQLGPDSHAMQIA